MMDFSLIKLPYTTSSNTLRQGTVHTDDCDYLQINQINNDFLSAHTLLPLSTLNLQDGRLSGKLDSSETLFAVVTVVEVAVVIVAVIEAVLLTVVVGWII